MNMLVKIKTLKSLIAIVLCAAATSVQAKAECDEAYGLFKAIASVRDRGISYDTQIRKTDQLADRDRWPDAERQLWKLTIKKVYAYAPYADLTPGQIGNLERGSCELRSQ